MLKEIALIGSALVSLNANNLYQRNNSHVVEQDGMAITYKYETNVVNGINSLVDGNIYHFELNLQTYYEDSDTSFNLSAYKMYNLNVVRFEESYNNVFNVDDHLIEEYYTETIAYNEGGSAYYYKTISSFLNEENLQYMEVDIEFSELYYISCDFVYNEDYSDIGPLLDFGDIVITSSTYNEIVSVERIYPDNVMGYVSEFIDENILNGIPNIDNVAFSIGGQDITMRSWLNTTICVAIAISIIILLYLLIRWIFRVFSSAFKGI